MKISKDIVETVINVKYNRKVLSALYISLDTLKEAGLPYCKVEIAIMQVECGIRDDVLAKIRSELKL